jgi:hypothetical protein
VLAQSKLLPFDNLEGALAFYSHQPTRHTT